MAQSVEKLLEGLLKGEGVDESRIDLYATDHEDYVPITKETVCYIVCGLLMNEHGEVLMMQEAKSSCYGTWYLPAGRMEPNETIQEGAKREVLEETGIEFEPTTLLAVEAYSGFWYRFTLTGTVTGGKLKDYDHRDKESLQAKWCTVDQIKGNKKGFPIRCHDIFHLIDLGVSYRGNASKHPCLQPVLTPHKKLLLRLVCLHSSPIELQVLQSKQPYPHFPMGLISPDDQKIEHAIRRLLFVIFGSSQLKEMSSACIGVLGLEYCGKPAAIHDGLCLTLLLKLKHQTDESVLVVKDTKHFEWHELAAGKLRSDVESRMKQGQFVPFLH